MKRLTLQFAILIYTTSLFAQWIPVNNGLPDYPPTALCAWVDTMVVSTQGGGIYKTNDNGENWIDISGNLPNLFVNDIRYNGGQFDPIVVSTEGGPFGFVNGVYIDCNGTGLTNTSINFWLASYGGITADAVVGTNGDGTFAADYTSPLIYDWYQASAGLSGDALIVNDGHVGEGLALIATNGGMYRALNGASEWSALNDGLSGEALKVNKIGYLGFCLLATDGGLYISMNLDDGWSPIISDEKFNIAFYMNTNVSPTGFMVYALGEKGFYTQDFVTWIEMDFGGIEGEITAAQADTENLYIGFTIDGKDGKESGGMYRRPLEELVVGIEDNTPVAPVALLEQNHPNPFNTNTKIEYSIVNSGVVSLKIYDVYGNEVQTLANDYHTKGSYTIVVDAKHLKAGVFFYSLIIDNNLLETKRMVIVR